MRGIERADSVALDPHKGLFLPYGSGSLLVRDPEALRRAHTTFADYMPEMGEPSPPVRPTGPTQSQPVTSIHGDQSTAIRTPRSG